MLFRSDRTMLVPAPRVLAPEDATPSALPRIADRLRAAAVSHVLAVEPLEDPSLEPLRVARPERTAPLELHLYRLTGALPRVELVGEGRVVSVAEETDHVDIATETSGDGSLLVRDAAAPGWTATVDGRPAAIAVAEERYRQVALPSGHHTVRFAYRPPGLAAGLVIAAVSGLVVLALLWSGRGPAA